jgi:hypothetical protein
MPFNVNQARMIYAATIKTWQANACYGHPNSCRVEACDGGCICGLGASR